MFQKIIVIFVIICIDNLSGHNGPLQAFHFYPNPKTKSYCPNEDNYEYFLGKCFCAPG